MSILIASFVDVQEKLLMLTILTFPCNRWANAIQDPMLKLHTVNMVAPVTASQQEVVPKMINLYLVMKSTLESHVSEGTQQTLYINSMVSEQGVFFSVLMHCIFSKLNP